MNRRKFLTTAGALTGAALAARDSVRLGLGAAPAPKPFPIAVISDGLSPDFATALQIMRGYDVRWVEIRTVWKKYNTELAPEQIRRLKELLDQYDVRCSQVDTALYKCTLPGTKTLGAGTPVYPYSEQMEHLKRAADRAHAWGTDRLRIFTFWRVAEPEKIFDRIRDEVGKAAEVAKSLGLRLAIENEDATNVGTVHELAKMLAALPANVGANYDIGNGLWLGEVPFPDGYRALDPKRIWNVHIKGAQCGPNFHDCRETLTDQGQIDLKGQLRAFRQDGCEATLSVECEFEEPGLSRTETTKHSLEGLFRVIKAAAA
jgi:sugar phosphate isomerase/epimerase